MKEILRYSKFLGKVEHENQVIIANTANGKNFKLTKECFEILDQGVREELTTEEFLDAFEDGGDREYFEKVLSTLKEYRILTTKEENNPYRVYLMLTNRCNLNCLHCCVDASSTYHEEELDTEEWCAIADKLKGLNLSHICMTGGEPMIRTDFFEIAEYFKKHLGAKISLMSNATLINEGNADRLLKLFDGGFSFSLDGINEETCSLIRGQGTFARTMSGIEIMKSRGMKEFSLSFTITRLTKRYIKDFVKLAQELGAKPLLRHFDLAGRALEHPELMVEEDLMQYYCRSLLSDDEKVDHFAPDKLPECISCAAGKTTFSVSNKGEVYPCQLLTAPEYTYGSVKNIQSFRCFFENEEFKNTEGYRRLREVYPPSSEYCKDCGVKLHCDLCTYPIHVLKQLKNKEEICKLKRMQWEAIWQ